MITKFKIFESYNEIQSICDKYNIQNWELNSKTGRVDVRGNVDLSGKNLKELPLKFGRVGAYFNCSNNKLTSLEGGPNSVGGDFYCRNNQIRDFKVPEYSLNEDREFDCQGNPIHEIYKLFNTPKCVDLLNEYEVIGDGVISRVRLEEVFVELGMEIPKNLRFENWELV